MSNSVTVERLITELVFQGDIKAYDEATVTVSNLSEAAFAAAAALAGLAESVSQEVTQYTRLGRALGIGTQGAREMTSVFLSLGADVNDVSDALQTLSDYSLEAANGNEEWVKTFKAAGVNIDELKGKNPDELLYALADGISSLGTAAERAAASSRILGDDVGRKLLPLMVLGSEGIKRMREEARIFGGVITDEAAEGAVMLDTNLRRLRYTVDALRLRLGLALGPTLRGVTDDILDWVHANKEWLELKIEAAVDGIVHVFKALTGPIGLTVVTMGGFLAAARAAKTAAQMLALAVGTAEGGLGFALAPLVAPAGVLLLFVAAIEDLMYAAEGGPSVFADIAKAIGVESQFREALYETGEMLKDASTFALALGNNFSESVDKMLNKIPGLKKIENALSWVDTEVGMLLFGSNLSDIPGAVLDDQTKRMRSARRGFQEASGAIATDQFDWIDLLNSAQIAATTSFPGVERQRGQKLGIKGSEISYDDIYGVGPSRSLRNVNVTINANGLSAAEAETVVRNTLDSEIRGANDAASQGTR